MASMRLESFGNLSTGHLTQEVLRAMEHPQSVHLVTAEWREHLNFMTREYGFFIHVPDADHDFFDEDNLPQCIRDCFALARQDGVNWILFDRDEDQIDALPWYAD